VKGLLAILSKAKGAPEEDSEEAPEEKPSSHAKYIDEAVSAAKEGDWDGFGDALKACLGKD
jgi:hypothetical protein